jgi:histone-lysine N-methyltransferase SETMAR
MQKLMLTIVWNPSGFHLIRVLPSGCKFNCNYCRREILESLSEWRCEQAGGADRKLIVHADNARPHTHTAVASQEFIEENGPERAIHPPYSPDLAPSNFDFFSHVKQCLRGQSFGTADERPLTMNAVSRGIEKWTSMRLFEIGSRDSGNVLKPMVTSFRELKKVSWAESVLRGRWSGAHLPCAVEHCGRAFSVYADRPVVPPTSTAPAQFALGLDRRRIDAVPTATASPDLPGVRMLVPSGGTSA